MIQLVNVTKEYTFGSSKFQAVSNVNLTLYKGEFTVIIGPSGSGKSTLLNLIAGFTKLSSGEIFIKEESLSRFTRKDIVHLRRFTLGYIFQFFNLHPFLTAVENVELPMLFASTAKENRRTRAKELLKLVELEEKTDNFPHELSGGERQRVGIARALANDPEIILADEPTGNLDSSLGREILNYLELVNQLGKTIVLVSHDNSLLKSDMKIIKLDDGRIVSEYYYKDYPDLKSMQESL
ncbi:MAG: ABC transporter ATP-binding protein [Candidatus Hodarchaeales archaeon]|jgi:putative ABC transport system ATP-binding protein